MGAFVIAATLATAAASAKHASNAGKSQSIALKQRAKEEGDAVRDREVQRRRRLVRSLSNQIAVRGAQGVSISEGSPQAVAMSDVRQAEMDNLVDRANTGRRILNLNSQANQARRQGNLAATSNLIEGVSNAYGP